jgi:DNA-binding NarL/FixJ family response regulator
MANKPKIKVFLADDHPLLLAGLKYSLSSKEDLELIGEASDGFSAVDKIQANPPDVSLIDVDMPGLSGIGAIRILRQSVPKMKILVLSTYNDENFIKDSMAAGADGYVLKSVGVDELEKIIKSLHRNQSCLSPYLVNLYLNDNEAHTYTLPSENLQLTLREKEVIKNLAAGRGNKEISKLLFISTETVKSHVKNIYKKLKVRNRVEAVQKARAKGLLQ